MITSHKLIDKTEVEAIRSFIPSDIYDGFFTDSGRIALCSATPKELCGVVVFDAQKSAVIQSLYVVPKFRRDAIGTELLEAVIQICKNLNCTGVTMSLYDNDDTVGLSSLLIKEGFIHVSNQTIYRFSIAGLSTNPLFGKVPDCPEVYSLSAADDKQRKLFSNELIKNRQYNYFMDDKFDPEVSSVFMKDGRILGCVLVSVDEDDSSICIEYANTTNCKNKMALMFLLKHAFDTYLLRYPDDAEFSQPTYGSILSTNSGVDSLIHKILPDIETDDHINTYAIAL